MVHHLKVFGSLAYGHVPEEPRKKLDNRSENFIFVGYHPTGAYKLYNPITNKVVISRDVLIDESAEWKWRLKIHPTLRVFLKMLLRETKGKDQ